jgi:hypothetical protein
MQSRWVRHVLCRYFDAMKVLSFQWVLNYLRRIKIRMSSGWRHFRTHFSSRKSARNGYFSTGWQVAGMDT